LLLAGLAALPGELVRLADNLRQARSLTDAQLLEVARLHAKLERLRSAPANRRIWREKRPL